MKIEKHKKWIKILEKVSEDVVFLIQSRDIYLQVRQIITTNENINHNNRFYDWISRNYGDASIMTLRRLIDKDDKTHSLTNLINDIKKNIELITKDWFISLYRDELKELGEIHFTNLLNSDSSNLTEEFIETDLQQIKQIEFNIKTYADKRIAHIDSKSNIEMPTYSNIFESIDLAEKITKRYYLLLTGVDNNFSPVIQYDWIDIFRNPWILK